MNVLQMKYYKRQKGYTFARLSELSGVPVSTIQKIFNGKTKSPRYDTLNALEDILKPVKQMGDHVKMPAAYMVSEAYYTLEDYYALPDEYRAELIDGVYYDMAAPSLLHQTVCMEVGYIIQKYLKENGEKRRVFIAPVDVQLDEDERTMVQPDLLIVNGKNKIRDRCIFGAPEFIMEVLSPSSEKKDAFVKLMKYQNAGVREYWMVDVCRGRIATYFFEEDVMPVFYEIKDTVPVKSCGDGLEINFAEVSESCAGMEKRFGTNL